MERARDRAASPPKTATSAKPCILLFSGGRDSTVAALQLAADHNPLTLLTITTENLFGLPEVAARVRDLAAILPPETTWTVAHITEDGPWRTAGKKKNCITCHHHQLAIAAAMADAAGASMIALGYSGYQADWPEQTPQAVEMLHELLGKHGFSLSTPVYHVKSRLEMERMLDAAGLSSAAQEQKCIRQLIARRVSEEQLATMVREWREELASLLERRAYLPTKIKLTAPLSRAHSVA